MVIFLHPGKGNLFAPLNHTIAMMILENVPKINFDVSHYGTYYFSLTVNYNEIISICQCYCNQYQGIFQNIGFNSFGKRFSYRLVNNESLVFSYFPSSDQEKYSWSDESHCACH